MARKIAYGCLVLTLLGLVSYRLDAQTPVAYQQIDESLQARVNELDGLSPGRLEWACVCCEWQ